jgi:hypothetical protein
MEDYIKSILMIIKKIQHILPLFTHYLFQRQCSNWFSEHQFDALIKHGLGSSTFFSFGFDIL